MIGEKELSEYHAFCTKGTPLPAELEADLKKGLFVVEDFVDELDVLRYRMLRERYGTDSLTFTLAPTNDCQFDCVYCYEKDALTNKYMTQEIQDKIVEVVKKITAASFCSWENGAFQHFPNEQSERNCIRN